MPDTRQEKRAGLLVRKRYHDENGAFTVDEPVWCEFGHGYSLKQAVHYVEPYPGAKAASCGEGDHP